MTPVPDPDEAAGRLADAFAAADLVAADPGLGGLVIAGGPGPARDAVLARLAAGLGAGAPVRRLPAGLDAGRLDGGLDLAATLAAGRPVAAPGLLAAARGGLLVLPSAERLDPAVSARLAAALDDDDAPVLVAFDEGEDGIPRALDGRLAARVDLTGVSWREVAACEADADPADASAAAARARPPVLPDPDLAALLALADAFGVPGALRAVVLAVRLAEGAARRSGRDAVGAADVALAVRLVLAPRATRWPTAAAEPAPPPPAEPPPPDAADDDGRDAAGDLSGTLQVEAAEAVLPPGLAALFRPRTRAAGGPDGRQGAGRPAASGGRPLPSRPGRPGGGARLDLLETLRAAAPLQRLRAAPPDGVLLAVRVADLRVRRCRRPTRSTAVFLVDASGSHALHRLAEAKGAVEKVLADCYVRRDRVAVIAFRGAAAETLLPPTGSFALARRRLADMPAGGATPLAAGIEAGVALGLRLKARGERAVLVLLTDGRANVPRDACAAGGRGRAEADALDAARLARALGLDAVLVDTAERPDPRAARLAEALGAAHLPLPRADAGRLAAVVRAVAPPNR